MKSAANKHVFIHWTQQEFLFSPPDFLRRPLSTQSVEKGLVKG